MTVEMKKSLTISENAIAEIEKRMAELAAEGVTYTDKLSEEVNVGGCRSSTCFVWA